MEKFENYDDIFKAVDKTSEVVMKLHDEIGRCANSIFEVNKVLPVTEMYIETEHILDCLTDLVNSAYVSIENEEPFEDFIRREVAWHVRLMMNSEVQSDQYNFAAVKHIVHILNESMIAAEGMVFN